MAVVIDAIYAVLGTRSRSKFGKELLERRKLGGMPRPP